MEPFKNLLDLKAATAIARAIEASYPDFPRRDFLKGLDAELRPLELKARMFLIKDRLKQGLPASPAKSFPILVGALKSDSSPKGLSGFRVWPLTQYVADCGIDAKYFEHSMRALHAMTQVFSAEFAIRYYLLAHEDRALAQMRKWSEDSNEHVRRLSSEGCRPYLPWGQKLPRFVADPKLSWPILDRLRSDDSKYVRTSVANHVNDHTRLHAEWVVKQLGVWHNARSVPSSELQWMLHRGLRNLVKLGHPGALKIVGVETNGVAITYARLKTKTLKVGESLEVEVGVHNTTSKTAKVIVDHQLGLLRSNGKLSAKVFKGKTVILDANEKRGLSLRVPLRAVTTRSYYPGRNTWNAIVNGTRSKAIPFELRLR